MPRSPVLCPAPQYSLSTKRSSPDDGNDVSPYSLSPVSNKSQKLLRSPRKPTRKISKIPFKVLDAPELQDDFYLNLVDWSSLNVLSVGLGTCVYLWSACTSQVGALSGRACRLGSGPPVPAPATLSQVPEARVVDQ